MSTLSPILGLFNEGHHYIYTSMPQGVSNGPETFDRFIEYLRDHAPEPVCASTKKDPHMRIFPNSSSWESLIRIAHDKLEFEFERNLFEQATGVPIGSPSGPEIAIITLHATLQQTWNKLLEFEPDYARMYFDDFFRLFTKQFLSKEEVTTKIHQLVAHMSCFKFDNDSFRISRIKELSKKPFEFFDIEIYAIQLTEDLYMLKQRVYTKPMGAYQYVPWTSAHPPATKKAIINSELSRRIRLSSSLEDWKATRNDLFTKLKRRRYPDRVLKEYTNKFEYNSFHPLRHSSIEKILNYRKKNKFPWRINRELVTPHDSVKIPLIIMYNPRVLYSTKENKARVEERLEEFINQGVMEHLKEVRVTTTFKIGLRLLRLLQKKSSAVQGS